MGPQRRDSETQTPRVAAPLQAAGLPSPHTRTPQLDEGRVACLPSGALSSGESGPRGCSWVGPHKTCALDAGVGEGLAGAELGEKSRAPTGVRAETAREALRAVRAALSLRLALGLGRAPARRGGCRGAAARSAFPQSPELVVSSTPPYLSSNCSPRAGVAQTTLWNFGGWGGLGKRVCETTWAQEVCGNRAKLVGSWKFCLARRKSGRLGAQTHTGWEGVKPAAGELPPLWKRKYKA